MTRPFASLLALAALAGGCATAIEGGDEDSGLHIVGDGTPGGPFDGTPCTPDPAGEACNGVDDDCDGEADEGFEGVGDPCTRGSGVCERGGSTVCTADGTGLECSAVAGPAGTELCGTGIDEDCDGSTDEGFDGLGTNCDGADADLCADGVLACSDDGLSVVCTDGEGVGAELCNGVDDDCNPATADGSSDPAVGLPCDGADGDLCPEGVSSCAGGSLMCGDTTGTQVELCNGADDDCNAGTADGAGDPQVGQPCDGADGDLCLEGSWSCGAGGLACGDTTGTTAEVCNSADDDCDGVADDGFNLTSDVNNCGGCGVVCTNAHGTTACSGGVCAPSCSAGWLSCDGNPTNGCELRVNDDPLCSAGLYDLGALSGDTGGGTATDTYYDEEWDVVRITEDDDWTTYVSATIQLVNPAGIDFDLYVYCASCGGTLIGSSSLGAGSTDTVNFRLDDSWGSDDSRDLIIEIRHFGSTACGNWTLNVYGNTSVAAVTPCP